MLVLEVSKADIQLLSDADLRELVGRLCEAEVNSQSLPVSSVRWGGAQTTPDGGLDVEVELNTPQITPDFLPSSHTGIQVKKNSMGKGACFKEMHQGKGLRPIIKTLIQESGAYIMVSGSDDCSPPMLANRVKGMREAVSSEKNSHRIKLDFYGADRLVTWIRKHPIVAIWLRSKIGKPLDGWSGYERWANTPAEIEVDRFLIDDNLSITDMTSAENSNIDVIDGLNRIRGQLNEFKASIRITGLSGVGKTRFAQALFEKEVGEKALNQSDAIYVDLGRSPEPSANSMLTQLIANKDRAIMIVDNCPPDVHRQLSKELKKSQSRVSLLSIEYDISGDKPEETNVYHLASSSVEKIESLLELRFENLGKVNSQVIAKFSGGNARLAIALASTVSKGESLSDFSDNELFERLFIQRKGKDSKLLEVARSLSLLFSFSIDMDYPKNELETLGKVSGHSALELFQGSSELLDRKLVQQRSSWRAVLPHALANKLAAGALKRLPLAQIISALFIPEDLRLLKSFSKRLSFLHDSDEAVKVVELLLSDSGVLENKIDDIGQKIDILRNIAPVKQEEVLRYLKNKSGDKTLDQFHTGVNNDFRELGDLLHSLAYEVCNFEAAVKLLIELSVLAEGESLNSISEQIRALFSLHLSGTKAGPELRLKLIRDTFFGGDDEEKKIALMMLEGALKASHWSSTQNHEFGARPRDFGYQPKTNGDIFDWFNETVKIAEEISCSGFTHSEREARRLLGRHFREILRWGGTKQQLIKTTRKVNEYKYWSDGLGAVRDTLHYDGADMPADLVSLLREIEKELLPSGIDNEIEVFVLRRKHDNINYDRDTYDAQEKELRSKIISLGSDAAKDVSILDRQRDKVFSGSSDALRDFGNGIAKGASDPVKLFKTLLEMYENCVLDSPNCEILCGYIEQIAKNEPLLASDILGLVLSGNKVKANYVFLQCFSPIDKLALGRLIDLAKDPNFSVYSFGTLAHGRVHQQLNDDDFSCLLSELLKRKDSGPTVISILSMRFLMREDSGIEPSELILSLARKAVLHAFTTADRGNKNVPQDYDLNRVVVECLDSSIPSNYVKPILHEAIAAIREFRVYSFNLDSTLSTLCQNHITLLLDIAYHQSDKRHAALSLAFSGGERESSCLSPSSLRGLTQWIESHGKEFVDELVPYIFPFLDDDSAVSEGALAIINYANDKRMAVDNMYKHCFPNSWSGSRVLVMKKRRKLLSILHASQDREISEESKILEKKHITYEAEQLKREASEHSKMEQTFE